MKIQKYYVVWLGRKPGIYHSWKSCQNQIDGFKGAKYKAFKNKKTAEEAFKNHYFNYIGKPSEVITPSKWPNDLYGWAVDAACSGNPGIMEYRGVDIQTQKQIFIQGPFHEGTNNIGEFLALVHALVLVKDQNMPIYTDSNTAIAWLKNVKVKTSLKKTTRNKELFLLIERAENWLINNIFSNPILKWQTKIWGEIPADFGRK